MKTENLLKSIVEEIRRHRKFHGYSVEGVTMTTDRRFYMYAMYAVISSVDSVPISHIQVRFVFQPTAIE